MSKSAFLIFSFARLTRHPSPSLQVSWNFTQLGLFIFPLFPALGGIMLFVALVSTWRHQLNQIIRRPLNWGFAILSLWLIISAGVALNPSEAFLGTLNFLPFFLFFAALSELIQTPDQLRQLAWILVLPSVPIVILGFGQLFFGWVSPNQLQNFVGWGLDANGNPVGRMASVFMYANILAAYLQIIFILTLGLWIEAYQNVFGKWKSSINQLTRSFPPPSTPHIREEGSLPPEAGGLAFETLHSQTQKQTKLRINSQQRLFFLSVIVIANVAALVLTNSRNAWAITILSCLTFAIYQGWRWLVAASAGVAATVFGAAFGPSPVREWLRTIVPDFFWLRLTDQLFTNRPVATLRTTQWQFAWWMTQQRPWTGWGLRNFTPLYQAKMQIWLGHPHSLLLMLSAETGIPATMFFCGLVSWVLAQGILLIRKTQATTSPQDQLILFTFLIAFFGCSLFNTVDITLFDLRVNTYGWLLLSAICGRVYHKRLMTADINQLSQ